MNDLLTRLAEVERLENSMKTPWIVMTGDGPLAGAKCLRCGGRFDVERER